MRFCLGLTHVDVGGLTPHVHCSVVFIHSILSRADAWEKECKIQRKQSTRTARLMPEEVNGSVTCLAFWAFVAGDREVQAAGHFEIERERDVGDADAELVDRPSRRRSESTTAWKWEGFHAHPCGMGS